MSSHVCTGVSSSDLSCGGRSTLLGTPDDALTAAIACSEWKAHLVAETSRAPSSSASTPAGVGTRSAGTASALRPRGVMSSALTLMSAALTLMYHSHDSDVSPNDFYVKCLKVTLMSS